MAEQQALDVIRDMIRGWEALDTRAVAACFAEDGVWHNMPYPPIVGRAAIEGSVGRFLGNASAVRFVIRHMGEISPGVVVSERNDIFTMKDGRTIDIPVMGVFEIAHGAIRVWRDYFDAAAMPA